MAHLRPLADLFRARFRNERGFSIIEVVVSALLVGLVAIGGFAALDSAGATTDRNKSRNVGSALAQADQERMRGMKATDLSALSKSPATNDKTVDGETYTVRSSTEWVTSGGATPSCSASSTRAQYLATESKVTWPAMGAAQPVTSRSLKAVPNGSLPNEGSLAISVTGPDGAGVSGLPISVTGPESSTPTTNANGCVLVQHIPAGTYTLSFNRSGWVVGTLPNASVVTDQVVVAGASTSSKSYEYAQAGTAAVRFQTRAIGAGSDTDTQGDRFTLGHTGLGIPFTKAFPLVIPVPPATPVTTMTGGGVYPFTSPYKVWAGGCADAKPSLNGQLATADLDLTVPAGATSATINIFEPTIRVSLTGMGTSSAYRVVATPAVTGCAPITGIPSLTTTTASSGTGTVNFTLPYGNYAICAQRTRSSVTVRKYASPNPIANNVRVGQTVAISFASGTSTATCPTS